jgi:hypothetical protein
MSPVVLNMGLCARIRRVEAKLDALSPTTPRDRRASYLMIRTVLVTGT